MAIAAGRKVGSAVQRNQLRRRIKAIFLALVREGNPTLPLGAYLVIARPPVAACDFSELRASLGDALAMIPRAREKADARQEDR